MSVTFSLETTRPNWATGEGFINLANTNARDFLAWLGLDAGDLYGSAPVVDMRARCMRRLWDVERNHDAGRPVEEFKGEGGCRVIVCERRPDYLREKTESLLALIKDAPDDELVTWG